MNTGSDERTLYELYGKLSARNAAKKKQRFDALADKRDISGITSDVSLLSMRLNKEGMVSVVDRRRDIKKAKSIIVRFSHLRGRRPEYISEGLIRQVDGLLKAVCKREAEMISGFRLQEMAGERIDISEIFAGKTNLNLLGSMLANDIIASEIRGGNIPEENIHTYFITDTGRKYHRKDCPFCKGRHLGAVSEAMVDNLKLVPCKCMKPGVVCGPDMTAFVDESIHTLKWDEKSYQEKSGSYSYIICRGSLKSEEEIRDELVVAKGVDFIGEDKHTERVTEAAIGKVLLSLLYDLEFNGNIRIYTDNKTVATTWNRGAHKSKLAKEFRSVEVSFIPRKMNKKADKLGRSRVLMDMAADSYKEAVKNRARIKELEAQLLEKDEEIRRLKGGY